MEAVDGAAVGEALLMAPVDLGLGAGGDLEAAVHLAAAAQAELGGDLRAAHRARDARELPAHHRLLRR